MEQATGQQQQQHCYQEIILDLNADCVEFCSAPDYQKLVAFGTYQLDEASRTRHGRLYLYSLVSRTDDLRLEPAAALDVPGIFDLQWVQFPSLCRAPCISLALADGSLQIVALAATGQSADDLPTGATDLGQPYDGAGLGHSDAAEPLQLQQLYSCSAVSSGMALSLDWGKHDSQKHQAAVSCSSGSISLLQARESGLHKLQEWTGHDLEAWMVAWDQHQAKVLYSGADDCTFKAWDIRCSDAAAATTATTTSSSSTTTSTSTSSHSPDPPQLDTEPPAALFINRRAHSAGVCCISSHPRQQHVLVTGSYDEAVRVWDTRMLNRPLETCQVSTGGGVWRLKWHPTCDHLLLAACMYNGFALVEADISWGSLQVVEHYKGHESIAYGADWFRGQVVDGCDSSNAGHAQDEAPAATEQLVAEDVDRASQQTQEQQQQQQGGRDLIATCSFYDRRLHLWSPQYHSGKL